MVEAEPNAGAPWLNLPKCLLEEIFSKLLLTHLPAASSVCTSWRSAGRDVIRRRLIHSVGLVVPGDDTEIRRLLLPTLESNDYTYSNVSNARNIPVPHRYHCCGTSFGWLFLVDDSLDMHLFNPLSGSKIELPPGTTSGAPQWRVERFGKCFMNKAFLSCKPVSSSLSETYALMIYLDKMVFCKLGDKGWTLVENPGPGFRNYMDAVYYRDKFYVVYNPGAFVTVDINANVDHPIVKDYGLTPPGEMLSRPRYLVEADGDLFQVRRYVKHDGSNVVESDNENTAVFDWGAHIDNHARARSQGAKADNEDEDNDGAKADNEDEDNDDGAKAEESDNDNNVKNEDNGNSEAEEHVDVKSDNENTAVFDWGAHIDNHARARSHAGADNEDEDNDDGAKADNEDEDNDVKNDDNGNGEAEEHVEDGNIKNGVNSDRGEEEESDKDNNDAGGEGENDENNSDGGEEEENGEDDSKDNHYEWARCYRTIRFKIFKLRYCSCCGEPGWEKVESIGDNVLFLGANTAFSLSASDFPGYKPNSIYFTDNYHEDPYGPEAIRHDIGVYSVEDKTVEHIYPIDSKPVRPTPFWFAPSHGKS